MIPIPEFEGQITLENYNLVLDQCRQLEAENKLLRKYLKQAHGYMKAARASQKLIEEVEEAINGN
jgi:hypothetical protein